VLNVGRAMRFAEVVGLALTLALGLMGSRFASLFNSAPSVALLAAVVLPIVALTQMGCSLAMVLDGILFGSIFFLGGGIRTKIGPRSNYDTYE
jgi:Na+-driven multidrug efflux pump